jgi:hypothetical protein
MPLQSDGRQPHIKIVLQEGEPMEIAVFLVVITIAGIAMARFASWFLDAPDIAGWQPHPKTPPRHDPQQPAELPIMNFGFIASIGDVGGCAGSDGGSAGCGDGGSSHGGHC